MGAPIAAIERVAASIAATEYHRAVSADGALVVDLDLSILGAEPHAYDEFERRVRKEYALVPIDAYRRGRERVLQGFLGRPRIYHTNVMHELLEAAARSNLERAISSLDRLRSGQAHVGRLRDQLLGLSPEVALPPPVDGVEAGRARARK